MSSLHRHWDSEEVDQLLHLHHRNLHQHPIKSRSTNGMANGDHPRYSSLKGMPTHPSSSYIRNVFSLSFIASPFLIHIRSGQTLQNPEIAQI